MRETTNTVPSPLAPPEGTKPHPDLDTWIAYHGGDLAESDAAPLRSHLAQCATCTSLILDLDTFVNPGAEDRVVLSEFEKAAAWRLTRNALQRRGRAVRQPGQQFLALAASILFGVVGLSLWVHEQRLSAQLQDELATVSGPQLNVPIYDLELDTRTRSGSPSSPLEISASTFSTLVLTLSEPRAYADFSVEILDEAGRSVWKKSGFVFHPEYGTLTLGLPHGFLAPGSYQVRLYGHEDGEKILLEDYSPFRVEP